MKDQEYYSYLVLKSTMSFEMDEKKHIFLTGRNLVKTQTTQYGAQILKWCKRGSTIMCSIGLHPTRQAKLYRIEGRSPPYFHSSHFNSIQSRGKVIIKKSRGGRFL